MLSSDYIESLKERGKTSRAYKKFQSTGLEIADILGDQKHKALYIKLAKIHNEGYLIGLAKDIAERKNISNKGAYFMKLLQAKIDITNNTNKSQNNANQKEV